MAATAGKISDIASNPPLMAEVKTELGVTNDLIALALIEPLSLLIGVTKPPGTQVAKKANIPSSLEVALKATNSGGPQVEAAPAIGGVSTTWFWF